MARPKQCLGEGTELAHAHRNSRPKKRREFMRVYAGRRIDSAQFELFRLCAVVAGKIRHNAHPGEHFAFERGFPSIKIGAIRVEEIQRRRTRVLERVAYKNISAGGNLRARQTCKQKQRSYDEAEFLHDNLTFPV